MAENVLGTELESCSTDPLTGFTRTGCCEHHPDDVGVHSVCAVMTEEFLALSKYLGNDLSTPRPEYQFPGLKPGDRLGTALYPEVWTSEASSLASS